jgi:acyl carrier protein phosphodiesterase
MNYLAHAYLSFNRPGILVGNMISDYVKGKKKYNYPGQIQQGIAVHREIDRFTDAHPATKEAKEIFRPAYRLYAGSLMDVIYDHFLALDENEFTDDSLKAFTNRTYAMLDQFTDHFPEQFSRMYPYMRSQDWLYNYRYRLGIEKSLAGVVRRAKYLEESDTAYILFNEHYDRLKNLYQLFFPELKSMTVNFLKQFDY